MICNGPEVDLDLSLTNFPAFVIKNHLIQQNYGT